MASKQEIDDTAKILIRKLVNSDIGNTSFQYHNDSHNFRLIYEVTPRSALEKMTRIYESSISAGAPGSPCACCNGSGRQ